MRAVEELVRRKLEKRAPDGLSPKPDPYELRAPQGCSLLFPTATQTEGNQSGQTLLSQNPTGVKLQRRLTVFLNGKYSNTTYISRIWPEQKKNRFSIKTLEPQMKQKNLRSSVKNTAVATLVWNPWRVHARFFFWPLVYEAGNNSI